MARKSILLTGLALGNESGLCPCSNLHTAWLFTNPQDLLWVDNIVITRREKEIIESFEHSQRPYDKAVWLIFQYLGQAKKIQIEDDDIITQEDAEHIVQLVEDDISLIKPEYLTSDDHTFLFKKHHYCQPALQALYAAIFLSWKLGTTISLDTADSAYFQSLYVLKYNKTSKVGRNVYVGNLLQYYLPEIELGHHFLNDSSRDKCKACAHEDECKDSYLSTIEQQIKQILLYREREEIRQLCRTIDDVIDKDFSNATVKDIEQYKHELNDIAFAQQQKMHNAFREYTKWRPLATCASIGLTVAGVSGNPVAGVIGAGIGMLDQLLNQYVDYQNRKNSWVNIVTERTMCGQLPKITGREGATKRK